MFNLGALEAIILTRAATQTQNSYTKTLLEKGATHCAKKFGEEAVEFVIATTAQSQKEVVSEAADVLFHLLVALKTREVGLNDVYAELERRTKQSGLEEKASRPPS